MLVHAMTVLAWGFAATVAMTTIMLGSQGLGVSRISLPFLFGTVFTAKLRPAYLVGYVVYGLGGWIFAFVYDALFASLHLYTWWCGGLIGAFHGAFLLSALLHVPIVHPRMASDSDRPRHGRVLEPPGFLGLHYGRRTPIITMVGHIAYGAILGIGLSPPS